MIPERIIAWLLKILGRTWVTLVLLSSTVSVILISLDEANWVKEDRSLAGAFLAGLLFGWLLACSRYSGLFATIYSLFISVVFAFESVGKILPSIGKVFSTPFLDLVNRTNMRGFEFSLRARGWIETLQAGNNIEDTGLFVLALGLILALCGAWMMWMLTRKQRALEALLPVGFLFAVHIHLSRQPVNNYWAFLFLAVLLIAQKTYARQHLDWQRRKVDYPEQIGLEWGGIALSLAILIALVTRAAPVFGTPEGWRSIAEWVEKTRQRTSDTAERLFSGVNPPPPPAGEKPDLYTNTPNLAEIGSPIPQGFETILWVSTSDPPPVPPDIAIRVPYNPERIHYWRSAIYATYTGRGWNQARIAGNFAAQGEPVKTPPDGRYYLRQNFEIIARHSGTLFAVNSPLQTTEGAFLRSTMADSSLLVGGEVSVYQVISEATRVTANQLAEAPQEYPPAIQQAYLQLPDSLPERVRSLAGRIAGAETKPYIKALSIQNYLRENYPYDLDVQPAPENRDVVDYFLFENQRGFCSHYATAMVVMLRSLDVPARVVTGYSMGEYDPERGAYRVPESAAHAWVEVYFPLYGWVEFEPTAYREPFVYPETTPLGSGSSTGIQLEEKPEPVDRDPRPYVVIGIVVLLLVLPLILLRLFSISRSAPAVQVDVLYRRVRRALNWAGLKAGAHITPDEYLAQYGPRLEPYRQLKLALRQSTELYRETTFSPRAPEENRVRAAGRAWQNSLREWVLLWIRDRWQRMQEKE